MYNGRKLFVSINPICENMGLLNGEKKIGTDGRYECGECGSTNQVHTRFFGTTMRCEDCGHEYDHSERISLKYRGEGWEEQDEEVRTVVERAEGDTVTRELLLKRASWGSDSSTLYAHLDEGEQPHHILLGRTVDVEGGGDSTGFWGNNRSRKSGTTGKVKTVLTDKRIFVFVPQDLGDDQRNIPYQSITGVDLDAGMIHKRLTVQTHGRTYHLSGTRSKKEDCHEAVGFIRRKIDSQNREGESRSDDPLDMLEKLSDLYEKGILTNEEYEEKKKSILETV